MYKFIILISNFLIKSDQKEKLIVSIKRQFRVN